MYLALLRLLRYLAEVFQLAISLVTALRVVVVEVPATIVAKRVIAPRTAPRRRS